MAQFEENSILREFLDMFQNGTPARLALFGVTQSKALLYIIEKVDQTTSYQTVRSYPLMPMPIFYGKKK